MGHEDGNKDLSQRGDDDMKQTVRFFFHLKACPPAPNTRSLLAQTVYTEEHPHQESPLHRRGS